MSIEAHFQINHGDFRMDVELQLPVDAVSALFGPSGCGKTTLLRALAGLDHHQHGYLNFNGQVWQDDTRFVPTHKRSIGYVFQEPSLFAHLNVRGNLEYGQQRVPKQDRNISLPQAIELLGIGSLLQRKPHTLSGGERQRVAIARALAANPQLLLMDEPLAALDTNLRHEILPYIESLHNELNIPIIYVSHSSDEVAQLASHLILLDSGAVITSGHTVDLLTRLDLPLAKMENAEALIEAIVAAHDPEYHLTYVDFSGGRFTVAYKDLPVGSKVRLRVAARDVSITLRQEHETSILNIFAVTVDELIPINKAQVTVRLLAGDQPMLSRITNKSAQMLDLKPGKQVYAQVKTVALFS